MAEQVNPDQATADTLPRLLAHQARVLAGRPAMRAKEFGIWRVWPWDQVLTETRALAAGLAALGVTRGATIGIIGDNRPPLYWSITAAQMIGAIPVPLFQEGSPTEIGAVIDHASIDVVIAEDQEQVDKLLAVRARSGRPLHVIFRDTRGLTEDAGTGLVSLSILLRRGNDWSAGQPGALDAAISQGRADDVAVILYTSGTTGPAKGVMLSHANVIAAASGAIRHDGLDASDEVLAYLPMAWIGDFLCSFAQSLVAGYCVSCPESGATLLADLREIGPTVMIAPPRVFEGLLADVRQRMDGAGPFKRRLFDRATVQGASAGGPLGWINGILIHAPLRNVLGLSRVRRAYVVGDAIGAEVFGFYRAIGLNLKQSYSLTEAGGFLCLQADGSARPGVVGSAVPGAEIRIDANGEILARGGGVFLGYHDDPAATAAVKTTDGWLRTGDTGVLEPDGQLRVIDRASDLGRLRSGAPFTPKLIENKLKFFPPIREAVAIGADRAHVVCLLDINADVVGRWAERQGIAFASRQELTARPEVLDLIADCVATVNADPALADQPIRHFVLLPKALDPDDGELTRMGKLRRTLIAERYAAVIEGIYAGHPTVRLRARISYEDGRETVLDAELPVRTMGPRP